MQRGLMATAAILAVGCAHRPPSPDPESTELTRAQLIAACRAGEKRRCRDLEIELRYEPTDALDAECRQSREPSICAEVAGRLGWALGVEEDLPRARSLYAEACAASFAPACEKLSRLEARVDAERCVPDKPGQGLAKEAILKVIQLHVEEPTWCYERELEGIAFNVDVTAAWTIGPEGTVLESSIIKDTRPEKQVGECVRAHILRWRFPCPAGGGTVNVTFPWLFRHD